MIKEDCSDLGLGGTLTLVSREGHCQPWTVWIQERLPALLIVHQDSFSSAA